MRRTPPRQRPWGHSTLVGVSGGRVPVGGALCFHRGSSVLGTALVRVTPNPGRVGVREVGVDTNLKNAATSTTGARVSDSRSDTSGADVAPGRQVGPRPRCPRRRRRGIVPRAQVHPLRDAPRSGRSLRPAVPDVSGDDKGLGAGRGGSSLPGWPQVRRDRPTLGTVPTQGGAGDGSWNPWQYYGSSPTWSRTHIGPPEHRLDPPACRWASPSPVPSGEPARSPQVPAPVRGRDPRPTATRDSPSTGYEKSKPKNFLCLKFLHSFTLTL